MDFFYLYGINGAMQRVDVSVETFTEDSTPQPPKYRYDFIRNALNKIEMEQSQIQDALKTINMMLSSAVQCTEIVLRTSAGGMGLINKKGTKWAKDIIKDVNAMFTEDGSKCLQTCELVKKSLQRYNEIEEMNKTKKKKDKKLSKEEEQQERQKKRLAFLLTTLDVCKSNSHALRMWIGTLRVQSQILKAFSKDTLPDFLAYCRNINQYPLLNVKGASGFVDRNNYQPLYDQATQLYGVFQEDLIDKGIENAFQNIGIVENMHQQKRVQIAQLFQ